MQPSLESDKWVDAVNKIVDRLPVTVVSAVVGVVVALLGATGGGIFGIPADSIQGGWRIAFGVAGAILFLASVWKFWRFAEPGAIGAETAAGPERSAQAYSLVMTAPEGQRRTFAVSKDLGEPHDPSLAVTGSVHPLLAETTVWVLRKELVREVQGRPEPIEYGSLFVYAADVRNDGVWRRDVPLHLRKNDVRAEYSVWAVVPTRDALLLFEHHWLHRRELDTVEREVENARQTLNDAGVEIKWRRRWFPVAENEEQLPSSMAETTRCTVVLKRE